MFPGTHRVAFQSTIRCMVGRMVGASYRHSEESAEEDFEESAAKF